MSVPKRHHFLPEFYLKGFCTAGELWVYDLERNEYNKRRPERVGIRKGFYTIEDQHGNKDHAEVEKRLSVIENDAALVIRQLDVGGRLKLVEKYALSLFAALLKFRTPAFERQMKEISSAVANREMRKLAPSLEAVQQRLKQLGYND